MENMEQKFKEYVKKAWKVFNKMEMRVLPGNVAFFFVLALIPIITISLVIASSFSISFGSAITFIRNVLPEEASKIIIEIISGKGFDGNVGTFNIIAFFVASNGTYAIINASNTLYGVHTNDFLRERVKSVVLLSMLIFLIVFLIIVPVLGGSLLNLIQNNNIIEKIKVLYHVIKWPMTFFIIFMTLKLIYTFAPSKKVGSRTTTYGALFTTVCWTVATAIFSYYLKFFANYNVIYGNISSIIILMIWVYIISYVFVMGIAINAVNLKDDK